MSYLVANLWLLISGLVLMSAKSSSSGSGRSRVRRIFCAIFCTLKANVFLARPERQTDRRTERKSTKNCMAKFSLLFLARYWAAFGPRSSDRMLSALSLSLSRSLRAPNVIHLAAHYVYAACCNSNSNLLRQLYTGLHTHTHTQWGTKYVYVYVIHQAVRVRLIKPANSASLGDLLQRFIRSLSVLHFALNFPIARNYVCLYIHICVYYRKLQSMSVRMPRLTLLHLICLCSLIEQNARL